MLVVIFGSLRPINDLCRDLGDNSWRLKVVNSYRKDNCGMVPRSASGLKWIQLQIYCWNLSYLSKWFKRIFITFYFKMGISIIIALLNFLCIISLCILSFGKINTMPVINNCPEDWIFFKFQAKAYHMSFLYNPALIGRLRSFSLRKKLHILPKVNRIY